MIEHSPSPQINTKELFKCCNNCTHGSVLTTGDIWCRKHEATEQPKSVCDSWKIKIEVILRPIIKQLSSGSRLSYLNMARLLRGFLISQGYSEKYVNHLKLNKLAQITDKILSERKAK